MPLEAPVIKISGALMGAFVGGLIAA